MLHLWGRSVTVLCEEKCYKLRMYGFIGTEISAEETADEITVYRCVVAWEMYIFEGTESAFEIISEFFDLC